MSINGLLASLAVTEALRMLAGLSEDRDSRQWRYEALAGEVYARDPLDGAASEPYRKPHIRGRA
jgi:hypothetical protein